MPAKKTAAKSSTEVKPPISDVAQPGQSAPDSTARPIIVKNHQLKQDPMVTNSAADSTPASNETAGETAAPAEPAQEKLERPKKIVIQPLHDDIKPEDDPVPAEPAEPTNEDDTDDDGATKINVSVKSSSTLKPTEADKPEATDAPKAAEPEKSTEPAAAKPAASTDKQLSPEEAEKAAEQAKEHQANLQKLVDNKTYFLPINTVGKRHGRRMAWLGLVLVVMLAVAWFDLALDGGLVPNTYNLPHTHLLRKK